MINNILLTVIIAIFSSVTTASIYNRTLNKKLEKLNTEFLDDIKKTTLEIINRSL